MSFPNSGPCQLHIQSANKIYNTSMKTCQASVLRTRCSSRFATCSWQAVLKWSYEKLVKGSKARWPLPCLMWRPSGSSAARPTGRTTRHTAPYTAETATKQAQKTLEMQFIFPSEVHVGCNTILTLQRWKAPPQQW